MDNQASEHNAEPASVRRYVKVFFYFAFIGSVLTAIANPAYARSIKSDMHALSSHQGIRAKELWNYGVRHLYIDKYSLIS